MKKQGLGLGTSGELFKIQTLERLLTTGCILLIRGEEGLLVLLLVIQVEKF